MSHVNKFHYDIYIYIIYTHNIHLYKRVVFPTYLLNKSQLGC
jgi:hypothetical protein